MSALITGVRVDSLPEAQREALVNLIENELREEERRDDAYKIRRVPGHVAPWPEGTVHFTDAEERTWFVRPDGSITWRT